jgi:hypothetical protein
MALKSDLLKPDYIDRYGGDTRKLEKPRLENPLFKAYKNDMSSRVMEASTGDDYSPDKLIQRIEIAREMGDDDLVQELLSDLYRLYGLYNQGGLASLPGYDTGGPVGSQLFGVDRPSERTTNARYSDVIRKIGEVLKKNWVTDKGGVDFKKFNRFALKHGVDAKDKSRSGKSNLVRFLNSFKKLTGMKYKPVIYDEPGRGTKSFTAESKIKQPPGTRGAPSNKEIYDKGKTLNRTALKKFPNSRADRLKYIVDGLYKTFNRYEGVTKKFLKEFVKKGKFLSPWGMMTGLAMEMMENPDYMKAVGFGESEPLTYKGGGMADINDMTRPLKSYAHGGSHEETIPSKHQFSPDDMNAIKEMLKSEMLRQNSSDINTDKIAYQFLAEMGYKATEKNLKGIRDAITMGMSHAQDELNRENTSDLGKLAGTARDKYQTFMESDDKMRLIGNKLGLGSLWP